MNCELLPEEYPYIKHHIYTDTLSTLRVFKFLDLLVSCKLHIGLTALSLGVPFYSYRGPRKARYFLKSVNADFAIWPENETLKLGMFLSNTDNICEAKTKFYLAAIEEFKKSSLGHIKYLQELVNKEN